MYRYLKDDQYYIDFYDLHTIEECLNHYQTIRDGCEKKRDSEKFKKYSNEEFDKEVHEIASFSINFMKAQRYKYKKETIQEWMDRDKKKQQKIDNAVPVQSAK